MNKLFQVFCQDSHSLVNAFCWHIKINNIFGLHSMSSVCLRVMQPVPSTRERQGLINVMGH